MAKRKTLNAQPNGPEHAIIYIRVSTKEQVKNLSLETQEARCSAWCKDNGAKVVRTFKDEGHSAKTSNRPGLHQLFEFCRKHPRQVQYLVVSSVDRFSRDTGDFFQMQKQLLGMGIRLRSTDQPLDESSNGVLTGGMASVLSHWDNARRSERTTQGMQKRIEKGGWPFMASLGYRKVKDAVTGPTLAQDPQRAPLIRLAFELIATGGHKVSDVVTILKQRGLGTRKNRILSAQSLGQILRRPVYAGLLKANGWTEELGRLRTHRDSGVVSEGAKRSGGSAADCDAACSWQSRLPITRIRFLHVRTTPDGELVYGSTWGHVSVLQVPQMPRHSDSRRKTGATVRVVARCTNASPRGCNTLSRNRG